MKLTVVFILLSFLFSGEEKSLKKENNNSGITFYDGSWRDARKLAKNENKLIFVEAYAHWCGTCKWMDQNTLKDPDVSDFFNNRFVNFKVNIERGDGAYFSMKYKIKSVPALLFVDNKGNVVRQLNGAFDKEEFLKEAEAALRDYQP